MPPLRSEIFTYEKLEQHAISLAKRHVVTESAAPEQLLKRLAENENILLEVYVLLSLSIKQNNPIAPGAEWLLDNFYLIEEQIYTGKKHLPKGYSKTLPRLFKGESAGLPRVYDMAVEIISHSDGHLDLESIKGFVKAYQTVDYLKLGELWAMPIMFRLALIENLRRLSILIAEEIANKALANKWADDLIAVAESDPKNLVLVIADMARSEPPMESTFVAELNRRLLEKGSILSLPLNWIESTLSELGFSSNELIVLDNRNQAATQVSVSNCINSFRFLSTTNWRDFVEDVSIVEDILKRDLDGVYGSMDFYTRDSYRHVVEKLAFDAGMSEQAVAEMAIDFAMKHAGAGNGQRLAHVGYYLTGKGFLLIARAAKAKRSFRQHCNKMTNERPLTVYLGGIAILCVLICSLLLVEAYTENLSSALFVAVIVFALITTTRLAVSLVNWLSTILTIPSLLPRMDFSKGIPDDAKTMVVIPTMLTNVAAIEPLLESLEVRFLANRNVNLSFALLTDFRDASTEQMPDDEEILDTVRTGIVSLNVKYDRPSNDTFLLFHRPRKWNPYDKIWMGYERKRGKLSELNALLRGGGVHNFSEIIGDRKYFSDIRYIITLDTDTQLPRDTAWKMIATMAHPLNQPVYCANKKRVTEGYSILQPRVSNSLPSADSSFYARLHGNDPGTDPYTKATSDVYQDLFLEGSFIGKGIYHIDAFEEAVKDRFPENRILSHDLLEGCYARCGLITDVQLYEEYPLRYDTDMQRRHRWIRGDWQIARWILPVVPSLSGKWYRNPLSLLSRWKIFDNVRRSLVPMCLLLLLLFGWMISSAAWFWTLAVTVIVMLPAVVNLCWDLLKKPADVDFYQHFEYSVRSALNNFIQQLLELTFLPYEAYANTDAIIRTIWRMAVSRKNLLQWNPFGNSVQRKNTVSEAYKTMWFEPAFAVIVYTYLSIWEGPVVLIALPFLTFWMCGPLIAYAINRPVEADMVNVSGEQAVYLRMLSRKIWGFFEKFVTAEDHWLPPDNYQEEPVERVAHRTSPTNIGLSLLANLTAYDFGYIHATQLIDRTENAMATLHKMDRYRGHLFNWYDTITLAPLYPKYVSTVDSGNMAAHLITLKQGLLHIADEPLISDCFLNGLSDLLHIIMSFGKRPELLISFKNEIDRIHIGNLTLHEAKETIEYLQSSFRTIASGLHTDDAELNGWVQKVESHLSSAKTNLVTLVPWLMMSKVPEKFRDQLSAMNKIPTLRELSGSDKILNLIKHVLNAEDHLDSDTQWLADYSDAVSRATLYAQKQLDSLEWLAAKCMDFANIDFDFLYDRSQNLLSIGYNVDERRRDNSFYDMLASEARLTTFIAIAQGKLPQESWFALGRQLTSQGNVPVLLSWSGSMFEYLMPLLVMPTYQNTLLDQTYHSVVQKQIEYGKQSGVPWGVSESGYNMVDAQLNYQYRAFGVPGIGFKRGLGEDLVISPYSTVMALMVTPNAAYKNLQDMKQLGFEGRYGFYEAIDYTASRLLRKQKRVVIRSFMAHHQGMSLLSLAYLLQNRPMQQRFESDVHIQSALLLLQERIPRITTFYSPSVHAGDSSFVSGSDHSIRVVNTPHTQVPEIKLLSNGRYHVMVTNSGGGYSRWKNIAVNRWREDITCDNWGSFCYIRDLDQGHFWSTAYQPTLQQGENYEAVFSEGRAEFRRRDFSLETHTEIVVSPEDDIELRRVRITNRSRKKRTLEISSYAEVVLTTPAADEAHPAFSNLFVKTEIINHRHAIIVTRRPRSEEEKPPYMFHVMKVHDAEILNISYETDRDKFIGRGNSTEKPKAMQQSEPLSGSAGSVLDPIVSVQYRIELEGNESVTVDILYGMAETKEVCLNLVEKYQQQHLFNRVLELAWTHSQVILRQMNAQVSDTQLYTRLAGSIIYANQSLRADPSVIINNKTGQSGLWRYSISGDIPIVLVQLEDASNILLIRQMLQAHLYWSLKGLMVDLVIWNDDHSGYRQELHNQILGLIAPEMGNELKEKPGGIFIRSVEHISHEDRILFESVAHVIIADRYGTLEEQINRRSKIKMTIPHFSLSKSLPAAYTSLGQRTDLLFYNGIGGFSPEGNEYIIYTTPELSTPAPWINVLANAAFGSIVTESGQSYTWVENAHEIRLTPWNNDPVTDLKGEVFYLRDELNGNFWSPAPLPCRGRSLYVSTHGFGYSKFQHSEDGIYSEMMMYTDIELPVKYIVIKLHNQSGRPRRISATGYVEWVLGDTRSKYLKHTVTEIDESSGALLASNVYSSEFAGRVAFFDTDSRNRFFTTDRTEFIGRNGTLADPEGLHKARLSGKTGAALDPCAVLQVAYDLAEDEERELIFRLGAGTSRQHALEIIQHCEGHAASAAALHQVNIYWRKALGAVQMQTPDLAFNILSNGWLNYQTLSGRLWARSGFYQSGGAFGFRDQLQDVISLLHSQPLLCRSQILLCASRQFREGDVQHWWHPPSGRGVRTTCSDDYLWLPFVVCKYITTTDDTAILEEQIHYLEGRLLNEAEDSYYDLPIRSDTIAGLYEHCVKAISYALKFGAHGLPFIGSGDWNDGMDKVGNQGRGESVWLAFFLYDILMRFEKIALLKSDFSFAKKCTDEAALLKSNIRQHGWDGQWYRRAYFDDGTPLGSHTNEECKIDSIAQSWSVLSKAGDENKIHVALHSAENYLVKKDSGLIQLFDPPFDHSALNPGYIKGYVPGVRENGGQYTHAAIWLVMAFAAVGDTQKTWALLQMINPLNRGDTPEKIRVYKTEPYVMAADVYAEPLHKGQGGWTWYTGSAGWMYQLMLESFIGLQRMGSTLHFKPCIPNEWKTFDMTYHYQSGLYQIRFLQVQVSEVKQCRITVDGSLQQDGIIQMLDDGKVHEVLVELFRTADSY
ncbi:MAG: cyclic beta 1-2 glucan synthetase [Chitinophagaceae bacterium]|nr:cyclic beta 1-2 glucan synthetase [Chitinophagaceae bacterium]